MKRDMLWVGIVIMILLALWGAEEYRGTREITTITSEKAVGLSNSNQDKEIEPIDLEEKKASVEAKLEEQGNFKQIGTLLNYDSKTEKESDNWRLLYDKPGASVRQVNLTFEESSKCKKMGVLLSCSGVQFINGDRVEMVGEIMGENVEVINIRHAKEG